MDKHKGVKKGDKFYYLKPFGLSSWGKLLFPKVFFIQCEVVKVTNAQFTTSSGRYRKSDGYCIGDGYNIYKAGDKARSFYCRGEFIAEKCQKKELEEYAGRIQKIADTPLQELNHFQWGKIKNLEVAEEASALIKRLKLLVDSSKQ